MQINPAYQELNGGWTAQGELTGQVLYDKVGLLTPQSMRLYKMKHTIPTRIFHFTEGQAVCQHFCRIFHANSRGKLPRYVAYEIKAKESDWWIDSWLNYTHQKTIWQYPVISAAQNRKQGGWLNERVFSTVQDARRCYRRENVRILSA